MVNTRVEGEILRALVDSLLGDFPFPWKTDLGRREGVYIVSSSNGMVVMSTKDINMAAEICRFVEDRQKELKR